MEGYVYAVDITAWARAHLVLGVVIAAVGIAVRRGQSWAWLVGLLLVGLSLVVNFIFIPHQPVWSMIVIGLDIVIVFALSMGRPRCVNELSQSLSRPPCHARCRGMTGVLA